VLIARAARTAAVPCRVAAARLQPFRRGAAANRKITLFNLSSRLLRVMILARNGRYDEARMAAKRALKIQNDFQPALELLRSLPADH
jgi:hypothetical protein